MKKIYTLVLLVFASIAANAQCSDLYFSEYIEGGGNNKALEIYNPTSSSITLTDYVVYRYNNGATTASDSFFPQGVLASYDVFVVSNSQADEAGIINNSDTTHTMTFFNGDDAIVLIKIATGDTLDLIGIIGNDPGSGWTVGSGATNNNTLVRKASIEGGTTDWSNAANEWDVYPSNTSNYIGSHTSSCDKSNEPTTAAPNPTKDQEDVISLFSNVYNDVTVDTWLTSWSSAMLEEVQIDGNDVKKYTSVDFAGVEMTGANSIDASGMDYISVDFWTPNATKVKLKLVDWGADNAFGGGDDTEHEVEYETFSQGAWISTTTNLSDFTGLNSLENISQIIFAAEPAGSVTAFIDNVYFSREKPYVVSDIADVVQLDADLAPTNEGDRYELTGIVHGIDFDGNAGLSFTLIDETSGINIFNFNDVSDYVVTEGDEIVARGEIDFYNGLLELLVDSIRVVSQGNDLFEPTDIDAPSEETESEYVRLRKVWIADTTTVWPSNGNVLFTNENQDTFEVRIDRDASEIAGTPVLYDTMTIVGIGGQFDRNAPYDEGYQVFPYKLSDITEYVMNTGSVRATVNVVKTYPNPANSVLNIQSNQNWNTFEVYSLDGVKQLEGSLLNNAINVHTLVGGNYILKLYGDNAEGVSRFVVLK
jgi:hypothetical protein